MGAGGKEAWRMDVVSLSTGERDTFVATSMLKFFSLSWLAIFGLDIQFKLNFVSSL